MSYVACFPRPLRLSKAMLVLSASMAVPAVSMYGIHYSLQYCLAVIAMTWLQTELGSYPLANIEYVARCRPTAADMLSNTVTMVSSQLTYYEH
jgi:hypothetical protein